MKQEPSWDDSPPPAIVRSFSNASAPPASNCRRTCSAYDDLYYPVDLYCGIRRCGRICLVVAAAADAPGYSTAVAWASGGNRPAAGFSAPPTIRSERHLVEAG